MGLRIKPKHIALAVFLLILATLSYLTYNKGWLIKNNMVYIPQGEFIMGSNDIENLKSIKKDFGIQLDLFIENEKPVRKILLNDFKIDKYEITNNEYKTFCISTNNPGPPTWGDNGYPTGKDKHPVNNVSWFDAAAYCDWAGKRLPTEEEWEKAARGPKGNRYTWGNEFNIKKANLDKGDTAIVGSNIEDKSFYGVFDLTGNIMEWTGSWYKPYPGAVKESKEYGETNRVLRGWSGTDVEHYNLPYIFSRTSARHYYLPYGFGDDIGFRCAQDA